MLIISLFCRLYIDDLRWPESSESEEEEEVVVVDPEHICQFMAIIDLKSKQKKKLEH